MILYRIHGDLFSDGPFNFKDENVPEHFLFFFNGALRKLGRSCPEAISDFSDDQIEMIEKEKGKYLFYYTESGMDSTLVNFQECISYLCRRYGFKVSSVESDCAAVGKSGLQAIAAEFYNQVELTEMFL